MAKCPQNDVLAGVLLADKNTRDVILPLIDNINSTKGLEWAPEKAQLLKTSIDNLHYHVYSQLMGGESTKAIYFPLLARKFERGFNSYGKESKAYLQKSLETILNGQVEGTAFLRQAEELFPGTQGLITKIGESAQRIQDKIILEYIIGGSKFKDKKKTTGDIIEEILRGKVPEKIKNDPIYQMYFNKNTEDTINPLRQLLIYDSIMQGVPYKDIKKQLNAIDNIRLTKAKIKNKVKGLEDIWDKEFDSAMMNMPEDPLYEEARKYKSAEEFVNTMANKHRPPEIEGANTLDNLGDVYPDDIYGPNGLSYYGFQRNNADVQSYNIIKQAKGNPDKEIMLYRAIVPGEEKSIRPGDWVTFSKDYAKQHGEGPLKGKYEIITKKVKAKDLATSGDDLNEWGYRPNNHKDLKKQQLRQIREEANKATSSFPDIETTKNWEEFQNMLSSNLDNLKTEEDYNRVMEHLKSLMNPGGDDKFSVFIERFNTKEGIENNLSAEEKVEILRDAGIESIVEWINGKVGGLDFTVEKFNQIKNKFEAKREKGKLEGFIKNELKSGSSYAQKMGIDNPQVLGQLKTFLNNTAETTEVGILQSVLDKGWTVKSLDEVVFFDPRKVGGKVSQDIMRYSSPMYNKFTLSIGKVKVASSLEELENIMKDEKILHIITPNQGLANHPDITDILKQKGNNARGVSSFALEDSSLFIDEGILTLGTPSYDVMKDIRANALFNGNIVDFKKSETAIDESNKIIKYFYPKNEKEVTDLIDELIGKGKTIRDLQTYFRSVNRADTNFTRDIISQSEAYNRLSDGVFQERLAWLSRTYNKEIPEVTYDDDLRELLYRATYGDSVEEVLQYNDELARRIWNDIDTSELTDTQKYVSFMENLSDSGLGIPFRSEGVKETLELILEGKPFEGTDFFQFLSKKNSNTPNLTQTLIEAAANIKKKYVSINKPKYDAEGKLEDVVSVKYIFNPNKYETDKIINANIDKNLKSGKNTVKKTLSAIHVKIGDAITQYQLDVKEAVSSLKEGETMSLLTRNELYNKLRNTLLSYEKNYADELDVQLNSYTFDIPRILTNSEEDIMYFDDAIDVLLRKYDARVDSDIALLSKKPYDAIIEDGKATYKIEGKVTSTSIEDYITNLVQNMPREINVMNILDTQWKTLTLESKQRLAKGLEAVREAYIHNRGLGTAIMGAVDQNLANMADTYLVTTVPVLTKEGNIDAIVPYILSRTNNSAFISNGEKGSTLFFDYAEDIITKRNIFKRITEKFKEGTLNTVNLDSIVREEVSKSGIRGNPEMVNPGEEIPEDVFQNYIEAFVGYTRISSIPRKAWQIADEIIANKPLKTDGFEDILNVITYKDSIGVDRPLIDAINTNRKTFPDILYREDNLPYNVNEIKNMDYDISTEEINQNIRNAVDAYENGFFKANELTDGIGEVFRSTANPILGSAARLVNVRGIVNSLVTTGINSSKMLSSLLNSKGLLSGVSSFFGFGKVYDVNYVAAIGERFKQYMQVSDGRIVELSKAKLSDIDNAAFVLAFHYRKQSKLMTNLTTDNLVNKGIQNDILHIMDRIYDVKDGKYVWRGSDNSGLRYLYELIDSLRNNQVFFGLTSLREKGIGYKIKDGWRGFGSEFHDDGLNEFNKLFNSNLNLIQYRTVMGALDGTADTTVQKTQNWIKKISNGIWYFGNSPFMRLLASRPGSFLAGLPSGAGYLGAISNFRRQLGENVDNYSGMNAFRNEMGILRDSSPDFTTLVDMKYVDQGNIYGLANMFSQSIRRNKAAWSQLLGQGFDNGQNVTDAIFGAAMKNYAMKLSLQREGFESLDAFKRFMDDAEIDETFKRNVIQSVINKTYDSHEAMINYTGRGIARNVDVGDRKSKTAGMLSIITNPISFRSGLGNNMIINFAEALTRSLKYMNKYGVDNKTLEALSKDPVVKQMLVGMIHDFAMAQKLANMNDYGENVNEQELTKSDYLAAMNVLSQQAQFLMMSGPLRVLFAGFDGEGSMAYNIFSQYLREMWRQMKPLANGVNLLQVWVRSDGENATAALDAMMRNMSTGGMRYMMGTLSNAIVPVDTGIPPMFQGSNQYQENYYDKDAVGRTVRLKNMMDEYDKTGKLNMDNALGLLGDVMMSNNVFAALLRLGKPVTSYIDKDKVINSALDSESIQNYMNNGYRYKFEPVTHEQYEAMSGREQTEYNKKVSLIVNQMRAYNPVGSSGFLKEIEAYYDTGETAYESNGYSNWNDPDKVLIFKALEDAGQLDYYVKEIKDSQNASETINKLTQHYVNFIDSNMRDTLTNYDEVAFKSIMSMAYYSSVDKGLSTYNKQRKIVEGDRDRKTKDIDKIILQTNFINRYWDEYQNLTSNDDGFSWGGLKVAERLFAEESGLNDIVFNTNDKGEKTSLKGGYAVALDNIFKTEAALTEGRITPEVTMAFGGIWDIYPESWSEGEKTVYDKAATMAKLMHNVEFIDTTRLPKETRDYLKLQMFAKMNKDSLDLKEVSRLLGDEFAENYRRTLYQNYKSGINTMNAVLEASKIGQGGKKGGGNGRGYSSKLDIGELGMAIKGMKDYMDNNKSEFYKAKIDNKKLQLYNISNRTKAESRLRPPEAPIYSAKSENIFNIKKKTTKKPRKVKNVKPKVLSAKKLTGAN